jgi:hypothetical protein
MTHYIAVQWFWNLVWCTCLWRHDAPAHAVWCSWCTLLRLGYPHDELVIAREITDRERIWVASRILTTMIPSALLVPVMWLKHTWCPSVPSRHLWLWDKTSPNERDWLWVRKFPCECMLVHLRFPNAPQCNESSTPKLWARPKSLSSGLRDQINHVWLEFLGRVWCSSQIFRSDHTSRGNALRRLLLKGVQSRHYTEERSRLPKQRLGLQCRLAAQKEVPSSANHHDYPIRLHN